MKKGNAELGLEVCRAGSRAENFGAPPVCKRGAWNGGLLGAEFYVEHLGVAVQVVTNVLSVPVRNKIIRTIAHLWLLIR